MSYKPQGYPSISPYLVVSDGQRLIDFLKTVFDGEVTRSFQRPDGTLMHAEVKIDDSIVMIGESTAEFHPNPSMVHVYVPDVKATWRRAMEAGAKVQQEPTVKDGDQDLRGGFEGPCGNSWWISTQVSAG